MNVKIAYTIPFERVPSKVDELLVDASRNLEEISSLLKQNQFEENDRSVIEKLEKIDKLRKELMTVDLLLKDCYTILAGYNKVLAEAHDSSQNESQDASAKV